MRLKPPFHLSKLQTEAIFYTLYFSYMLSVQCSFKKLKARGSSFKNYSLKQWSQTAWHHNVAKLSNYFSSQLPRGNTEQQESWEAWKPPSLLHPEGISYFHLGFLTRTDAALRKLKNPQEKWNPVRPNEYPLMPHNLLTRLLLYLWYYCFRPTSLKQSTAYYKKKENQLPKINQISLNRTG